MVVIDPGHGGSDPGGIPGQIVPEKTVALVHSRRDTSLRTNDYVTTIIQKMVGGTAAGDFTDHPEHLHFSKSG